MDRVSAILFFVFIVADGVFVIDCAQAVDFAGCAEDRFNERGFASSAMTEEYNVADILNVCHFSISPELSLYCFIGSRKTKKHSRNRFLLRLKAILAKKCTS
jgi:hypothetical protein